MRHPGLLLSTSMLYMVLLGVNQIKYKVKSGVIKAKGNVNAGQWVTEEEGNWCSSTTMRPHVTAECPSFERPELNKYYSTCSARRTRTILHIRLQIKGFASLHLSHIHLHHCNSAVSMGRSHPSSSTSGKWATTINIDRG